MGSSLLYQGSCHCGAIRVTLDLTKAADEVQIRACQCGFCTRHGAKTVSDPNGRAIFDIDETRLSAYQFATRTGTVLVCGTCGVYAEVRLDADGGTWSVVNVRGLAIPEFSGSKAEPAVYEGETADQRI